MLLQPDARCRLGCLRCDALDVLEGARALSFREEPLTPVVARLLVGLLTHNVYATELDLTATDLETASAQLLAALLRDNVRLTSVKLAYNPAVADEAKDALRAAAARRVKPPLALEL